MEPIERWQEEFEGAIKPHFKVDSPEFNSKVRNGDYFYAHMNLAWTAFCIAKRSQPVVELPNPFHDSVSGYECDELHESLDAAGIQYRIKGE